MASTAAASLPTACAGKPREECGEDETSEPFSNIGINVERGSGYAQQHRDALAVDLDPNYSEGIPAVIVAWQPGRDDVVIDGRRDKQNEHTCQSCDDCGADHV
jgi:hypothetical protein